VIESIVVSSNCLMNKKADERFVPSKTL
jgi:hypothetical protein